MNNSPFVSSEQSNRFNAPPRRSFFELEEEKTGGPPSCFMYNDLLDTIHHPVFQMDIDEQTFGIQNPDCDQILMITSLSQPTFSRGDSCGQESTANSCHLPSQESKENLNPKSRSIKKKVLVATGISPVRKSSRKRKPKVFDSDPESSDSGVLSPSLGKRYPSS